jgi:hypothetical protein
MRNLLAEPHGIVVVCVSFMLEVFFIVNGVCPLI